MSNETLVLDIGGTKIAAGLVNAEGQLLHQNRQPTPHSGDPDEVWAAAGTWHDVFGIEPHKLVEASEGLVTDLKKG
jgi:predicted NBD/HSP70 family sugar kinase